MNKIDKFHNYGLLLLVLVGAFYVIRVRYDSNDYFGMGFIVTLFFFGSLVVSWLVAMVLFKIFSQTNATQVERGSTLSFLGIFVIILLIFSVIFTMMFGTTAWTFVGNLLGL